MLAHALDEQLRVLVAEDRHCLVASRGGGDRLDCFLARLLERLGGSDVQVGVGEDLASLDSAIVPCRRTTSGTSTPRSAAAATTPSAIRSQRTMPPKMLTRIAFTFSSRRIRLERLLHLLLVGAAARVEEVRGRAAAVVDHVERRHREARAVHHAADVAVEADVGEVDLVRGALARILLFGVAQLAATSGFRYSALSSKLSLPSSAKRSPSSVTTSGLISTSEQSLLDEEVEQRRQEGLELLRPGRPCRGRGRSRSGAPGTARSPTFGCDEDRLDLLGRLLGDLLDVHAALGRRDDREVLGRRGRA